MSKQKEDFKKINEMSKDKILDLIKQKKIEIVKEMLVSRVTSNEKKDTSKIKNMRKYVARLLTVVNSK